MTWLTRVAEWLMLLEPPPLVLSWPVTPSLVQWPPTEPGEVVVPYIPADERPQVHEHIVAFIPHQKRKGL